MMDRNTRQKNNNSKDTHNKEHLKRDGIDIDNKEQCNYVGTEPSNSSDQ